MIFFLDSANLAEIKEAKARYPWIGGHTTNPLLLQQGKNRESGQAYLNKLAGETSGPFYAQILSKVDSEMEKEARQLEGVFTQRLVLKMLPTPECLKFIHQHKGRYAFCVTAVENLAQAALAFAAGAQQVAVYVHRLIEAGKNPYELMAAVRGFQPDLSSPVLAASLKSQVELEETLKVGVRTFTLTSAFLENMKIPPETHKAQMDFEKKGAGIFSP